MRTKRIAIHKLVLLPNVAAGMNPLVLLSLAHFYRSTADDAAPITVEEYGHLYRILDGRHRYFASVIAGRHKVLAQIVDK